MTFDRSGRMPDALQEAYVLDLEGVSVPLAREWAAQSVVLVLLRHFGCIFCRAQAAEMRSIENDVARLGARIVFIGSGQPFFARAFAEDFAIRWPVYADPELSTYRALEARHGFFTSANPRTWLYSVRVLWRGFRQGRTQGEVYQQGAVAIVLPDGRMPYLYLSAVAGDHPEPHTILEALERALRG